MPLDDTGNRVPTETGTNALAKDENNNTVVVVAMSEVVQDYSWDVIFAAASEKYDAGTFAAGPPPQVSVTTQDCANV